MEFTEVLKARHSVRKFTDSKIDRSILDALVEEAQLAPSSRNSKSSSFIIVEDRELLSKISRMRDYGAALLEGAAAAIVVLGDTTKTDLWLDNAAISATYLLLSAANRGLGSCWVHVNGRPQVRKDPSQGTAEEYLKTVLTYPEEMKPLCIVALGYPAE